MNTMVERIEFYSAHPDINGAAVCGLFQYLVVEEILNTPEFPQRKQIIKDWKCDPVNLAGIYLTMGVDELIQHWDRNFTVKSESELRVNALGHLAVAGIRAQLEIVKYGVEPESVDVLRVPDTYGLLLPDTFAGVEMFSPPDMQEQWLDLRQ
ncbi:MAG: hypothetical protein NTX11_04840 [Candidatus Saccharibacteria bacterium]|nr:hypothetical protein [Candidatus Saccharibacteria bacterium]